MPEDLMLIIEKYVNDSAFHEEYQTLTQKRNETLLIIQPIVYDFIQRKTNIHQLRQRLDSPRSLTGAWYAQGPGFMMELNKLSKYHSENTGRPEEYLRTILTGLKASNLGQRIEQLYHFLLEEQKRLRQANQKNRVAPRNSAFIISLFASWLDPVAQPTIYKEANRRGMYQLVKHHYLEVPDGLRVINDAIEITEETDHLACQKLLTELSNRFPQLKRDAYWAEYFGYWLAEYFQQLSQQEIPLFNETDAPDIFSPQLDQRPSLEDAQIASSFVEENLSRCIDNDPLTPTPEPLLTDLIHEVQRYILVDEAVIRRIYHALFAGHVILSGPPGTGKTELARLIPEILWKQVKKGHEVDGGEESETAYTTRLVTATDDWSVRTLISGITPVSKNGTVAYKVQYGHLTSAILKNWLLRSESPGEWSSARRTLVANSSGIKRGSLQTFRGLWLVIDEFNRAPIDLALGDALTALGGNEVLRVMTEDGSTELPIPKDFRIIGTLNSFDRNYLNQISEALKRRFSFIEIVPPERHLREAEQAMVLHKALDQVSHLRTDIDAENEFFPWDTLTVEADEEGPYIITWPDEPHPFREAFETAWRVFEVIRIYRQLGTAQAISLVRHMLIAGILQNYTTREQWVGQALDAALCDTIADQLQVLLPDEIEALLLHLTSERAAFSASYNRLLDRLADRPQRLYGQLLALSSVSDEQGEIYLTDEQVEEIVQSNTHEVSQQKLTGIFHLDAPLDRLPQFIRRLRAFKSERGL